jgi:hypothetical protein
MRDRNWFTLVELLAVIGVAGVLMGMAFPGVIAARRAAHRLHVMDQLRAIARAQLIYKCGEAEKLGECDENEGYGRYGTLAELYAKKLVKWPEPGIYIMHGYVFTDIGLNNKSYEKTVEILETGFGIYARPYNSNSGVDFWITDDMAIRKQPSGMPIPKTVAEAKGQPPISGK